MAIRFFSIGDIHNDMQGFIPLIDFINQAGSQNKCDFIIQVGDLANKVELPTDLPNIKNYFDSLFMPYYIAIGNHEVTGNDCYSSCTDIIPQQIQNCMFRQVFGDTEQVNLFTKDGVTYQIITIGMCQTGTSCTGTTYRWLFDFNRVDLSKTLPTLLVCHGPLVTYTDMTSCGAWQDCSMYAYLQNLVSQTDQINMLASYSGHVHAPRNSIINNRLYILENTISQSRTGCGIDTARFVGYNKITQNINGTFTTQYQRVRYQNTDNTVANFIDPFSLDCPQINVNINIGG